MQIWKTDKDSLSNDEILKYILDYETQVVPGLNRLWRYFKGDNETIKDKPQTDPNNPDNRTPVPYGRKIITTFTGYAYRPRYITYKAGQNTKLMDQLQTTFNLSKEHIKTARDGRNTGIFGVAYEVVYVDGVSTDNPALPVQAEPRFFNVDPREMILLYDYSPEPEKKIAIRYYKVTKDLYKVEVYYPDRVQFFDRYRAQSQVGGVEWRLKETGAYPNFFGAVPVVAYYLGDDLMGIIEPVVPLIDDYDALTSDSMNEFDRFAHAYLLMAKMNLVPPEQKKEPGVFSRVLANIKKLRVFENLPSTDAIKFLTKDIPSQYVEFMTNLIRQQIHVQSHVPDFTDARFSGDISGVAVQRLMFDFENLVSSAEAEFDTALIERLKLIFTIYDKSGRNVGDIEEVTISHKRNLPVNLQEFANTALTLEQAGFSKYLQADIMPDDIIPDVEEELARQKADRDAAIPDIDDVPDEPEDMEGEGVA
jgi:SPP1 family phage portal protein